MNASHPNDVPPSEPKPSPWLFADLVVIGLWLAIPIGVFVGRQLFRSTFTEFEVELSIVTEYLLHFYSCVFVSSAAFIVLLLLFSIPDGSARCLFRRVAGIAGALLGIVCLLAFLVPLVSLWQDLR